MADRSTDVTGSLDRTTDSRRTDLVIAGALFASAAIGWWWSVRMSADMDSMHSGGAMGDMGDMASMSTPAMSLVAFVVGWTAMMAAMMFPAISPMVRLYARAAAQGHLAPVPFFVAGYLVIWAAIGVPSYFAWRELSQPLADGEPWVGRLAGSVFVAAAAYQLTPLKTTCLKHCRSPISFFIRYAGTTIDTPARAASLGVRHGAFCFGCCWAIMAILVVLGTMNLAWMVALSLVIFVEKVAPRGEQLAVVASVGFVVAGALLLADPTSISAIT